MPGSLHNKAGALWSLAKRYNRAAASRSLHKANSCSKNAQLRNGLANLQ